MDARCRIELLGGLRVLQGDRTISRFSTQKIASLLATLAHQLDRTHPREALIERFWPESDLPAGRVSLNQALSRLRRQLEPPGVAAGSVIQATPATVRLNPAAVTTDVAEFETALRAAGETSSDLERRHCLESALLLYRGELLPGLYDDWVLAEQRRLADRYFQALRALARLHEATGELAAALDCSRRAVAAEPLNEPAHAELMRLYAAAGQPATALEQYRTLEGLLQEELGAIPAPATRALVQKLQLQADSGAQDPHAVAGKGAGAVTSAARGGRRGAGERGGPRSVRSSPASSAQPTRPLPRGTVTFLLCESERGQADAADHLRAVFREQGGRVVQESEECFTVAFGRPSNALAAALAVQLTPPSPAARSLRIALHTGEVEEEGGSYRGPALGRAARILTAAHGGQILCSQATAELLRRDGFLAEREDNPDAPRLRPLGLYRLRDEAVPERLFQVEHPDLPRQRFPPPRAEAGYSSNLPFQLTHFFGREAEIERLTELLAPRANGLLPSPRTSGGLGTPDECTSGRVDAGPDVEAGSSSSIRPLVHSSDRPLRGHPPGSARLVTLTGVGGTGKTRLALEVARRLLPAFQGAVWFVPLADLRDPALIPGAVLSALRLARDPEVEVSEQLAEALGGHSSLLVLDNFEQLLAEPQEERARSGNGAADGTEPVCGLLEQLPALTCLVTSRQRLDLGGEREFVVQPLPTPHAARLPEQLTLFDSVRLFVDRAQGVKPDFQVTRRNAAAVAELCNRLEGIPLALELAAARALLLTPAQMLAQLERRFDFLVTRRRDAHERHRTLRAAIEWSYRLLSPDLQRFFARLSVFRGGWTLEAAEAVCVDEWTCGIVDEERRSDTSTLPHLHTSIPPLDALAQLRDCSLITVEEEAGGMRYRMLETLREFAAEQLPPEDGPALGQRHLGYFLEFADSGRAALAGPGQGGWLARLDAEHENLRAALEFAGARLPAGSEQVEEALRLGAALGPFWEIRGHWTEGRRLLTGLLTKAHQRTGSEAHADCLNGVANLIRRQGDLVAAQGLYEESLAIRREIGDTRGIAGSLHNLGNIAYFRQQYAPARRQYEEALAINRAIGNRAWEALNLGNLALVASEQGDFETSRRLYQESLEIQRALGNHAGAASSLNGLGLAILELGDPEKAGALFRESLAIARELGLRSAIVIALLNLGALARQQGDDEQARAFWEECREIEKELGGRLAGALGTLAADEGRYSEARRLWRTNLSENREMGHRRGIAACLDGCAYVLLAERPAQESAFRAARLYGAAEALREAIGSPLPPSARAPHERSLAAARALLGEADFTAAWAEGRALTMEAAITEALSEI